MDSVITIQDTVIKQQEKQLMTSREMLLLKESSISLLNLENLKLQGELAIIKEQNTKWYQNSYIVGSIGFGIGILIKNLILP